MTLELFNSGHVEQKTHFNNKHTSMERFSVKLLEENLSIPEANSEHCPLTFLGIVFFFISRSVPFQRHEPLPTTNDGTACNPPNE